MRITFYAKSEAEADKLRELASFSPVYNTLLSGVNVDLQVRGRDGVDSSRADTFGDDRP